MAEATMRAAVYRGPGEIGVEEHPVPEPGADEVRVRVGTCGLCGTDLHLLHMDPSLLTPGQTPGHEIAGTVDALGPGVRDLGEGDPVAIEPLLSCGSCVWCKAGRDSICPQMQLFGIHEPGGFADYVVVPARRLFPAPQHLEFPLAALAEPVAVAVHGLKRGGLEEGQRVLVLGAGSIGLLTVAVARAMGAGEILLTARHPHQAELGSGLGASRVLGESETTMEALTELASSTPPDLVVETVGGTADTLLSAGAALAPGGAVSVVGVFTGPVTLDPFPLLLKEATLAWSNCYARPPGRAEFEEAIDLISAHHDALQPLLTHQVPLDEIERAFAVAGDKGSGSVKVSVVP